MIRDKCIVGPAWVLQEKYGLFAENRPKVEIDSNQVPIELHPVIPIVETWSISDDIMRCDFIEKQTKESLSNFYFEILPYRNSIEKWLSSLPKDVCEWPAAAIHFMYCLSSHDYAEIEQESEEEKEKKILKQEEETRPKRMERASQTASDLFRAKDFSAVIRVLTPFSQYLKASDKAKLNYALKHVNDTQ